MKLSVMPSDGFQVLDWQPYNVVYHILCQSEQTLVRINIAHSYVGKISAWIEVGRIIIILLSKIYHSRFD